MTCAEEVDLSKPHILVVGAGSVGKRHLRNLSAEGCTVSAVDPRQDRLDEAADQVQLTGSYASIEVALADTVPCDGVVIASPPTFHVDQSIAAIERAVPVLLEKPVSPDLASAIRLQAEARRAGVPILLGYTYRWWPPLRLVKQRIGAGEIGQVLGVRCVMSAHLADWHPWEKYQDFFMASRELGGGALLDESHFVDLMYWIFGMPESLFASVERVSGLDIQTDDNVDAWLRYDNGPRVNIHLDLYGRPHEKHITFVGETGTLVWSFDPNRIRLGRGAEQAWEDESFAFERNHMFEEVGREFLDVVTKQAAPSCTAADGVAVMRLLEAMRESSASRSVVRIPTA